MNIPIYATIYLLFLQTVSAIERDYSIITDATEPNMVTFELTNGCLETMSKQDVAQEMMGMFEVATATPFHGSYIVDVLMSDPACEPLETLAIRVTEFMNAGECAADYHVDQSTVRTYFSEVPLSYDPEDETTIDVTSAEAYTRRQSQIEVQLKRRRLQGIPDALDFTEFTAPVRDQGGMGSCSSFAAATVKTYHERVDYGNDNMQMAPLYIYSHRSNYPSSGMYSSDTWEILRDHGDCEEYLMPYSDTMSDFEESQHTSEQTQNAAYHKITGSRYSWSAWGSNSQSLEDFKELCKENFFLYGPAWFAVSVYNYGCDLYKPSTVPIPQGGHAMTLVGYDEEGMTFQNSWGNWCNAGLSFITWQDAKDYIDEIDWYEDIHGSEDQNPITTTTPTLECVDYSEWPHVSDTCENCRANIQTYPYDNCADYCASFDLECVSAAESVSDEGCETTEESYSCDTVFEVEFMLCSCRTIPEDCFDVSVMTDPWGHEMSWTLVGNGIDCSVATNVYDDNQEYAHPECCVPDDASWTLTCSDSYGDGWGSGWIKINDVYYCDNFGGNQEVVTYPTVETTGQGSTAAPATTAGTTATPGDQCFDVVLYSDCWGYEMSWTLVGDGINCADSEIDYSSNANHPHPECCVPDEASWTLTCMDSYGDGWSHGYIMINAVQYCTGNFGHQKIVEYMPDGVTHTPTFAPSASPTVFTLSGPPTVSTPTFIPTDMPITFAEENGLTCLDITLVTRMNGNQNSWTLGGCSGSGYNSFSTNEIDDCCLAGGEYTLTCADSGGDGWRGGYIEIDGTSYCANFNSGSSKTTTMTIIALPSKAPSTPNPSNVPTTPNPTTSPETSIPTEVPTLIPTPSDPTFDPTTSPQSSAPSQMPVFAPSVSPTFKPSKSPSESPIVMASVELSMDVDGVDVTNKDEVCQSVADDLGGTVHTCILEGLVTPRRSLTPATLIVSVIGVNPMEAAEEANSESFVSNLNLPSEVTVSSVAVTEQAGVPVTTTTTQEPQEPCLPFSILACQNAALNLGLSMDANWITMSETKGCHAYDSSDAELAGTAWFGLAGTSFETMRELNSPVYRPEGFDCGLLEILDFEQEDYITCVDISMVTANWGNEVTWSLGDSCTGGPYDDYSTNTATCCFAAEQTSALLTCSDSYGDGWHGGYIEIDGESYCSSFSYGNQMTATIVLTISETSEDTDSLNSWMTLSSLQEIGAHELFVRVMALIGFLGMTFSIFQVIQRNLKFSDNYEKIRADHDEL